VDELNLTTARPHPGGVERKGEPLHQLLPKAALRTRCGKNRPDLQGFRRVPSAPRGPTLTATLFAPQQRPCCADADTGQQVAAGNNTRQAARIHAISIGRARGYRKSVCARNLLWPVYMSARHERTCWDRSSKALAVGL